jgi:5-methyltetrahydrofolate--homocysteine methyltransferase
MVDSTDHVVIEAALKRCQGKCIINSINLEDGEERFEHVVPLIKRYGGAVVVGCIDEDPQQGMGVTRQRKLEIATRSFDLLVNKYGLPARDNIFDALVFRSAPATQTTSARRRNDRGIKLIRPPSLTQRPFSASATSRSASRPPAARS